MDDIFYVLLLGFAVSIDACVAGVAYGLRSIRIPCYSLLITGIVTVVCTAAAMLGAYALNQFINTHFAVAAGACMLMALGAWRILQQYLAEDGPDKSLPVVRTITVSIGRLVINIMAKPENADMDHSCTIGAGEAFLLGLALGFDNMVAAFAANLTGALPYYTPLVMGLIQMGLIAAGCWLSGRMTSDRVKQRVPYLPGAILILLGLLRLI